MKFKLKGKPPVPPKKVNVYNFKKAHLLASILLMVKVFILALIKYQNPVAAIMITSAVSTSIIFFYFMIKDLIER